MTPTPTEQALQALRDYRNLQKEMRSKGRPPHTDYWHQSIYEAEAKMDAAIAALEAAPTGAAQAAGEVPSEQHPDDKAVNTFAERMKWKLAQARARGRSGWKDRSWTPEQISQALREHVEKGDPTDVANYCMFLSIRGEPITPPAEPGAEAPMPEPDGYAAMTPGGTVIVPPARFKDYNAYAVFTADQLRTYGDSRAAAEVAADRAGRKPLTDEQIDDLNGLDTAGRVRFYEHDFYVLSNFSAFRLEWQGEIFDTSEAAYHAEKFWGYGMVHTSWDLIRTIREAPSAHEAFKIAERNKPLRRPDWDDVKVGIMKRILRAKADQHEYVRRKLLATGDRELVEDSWRDDFWGWGPNRDGKNMLGKLWMEVRSELRGIQAGE
jgi:ribA/ribD-fused uncharacterized protein